MTMITTKKNSKATRKPTTPPAPEWVTRTPEPGYNLTMFGADDDAAQDINLTRDEYLALKRALAKMRGYKLPEPEGKEGDAP
jgi:hypothetical protein